MPGLGRMPASPLRLGSVFMVDVLSVRKWPLQMLLSTLISVVIRVPLTEILCVMSIKHGKPYPVWIVHRVSEAPVFATLSDTEKALKKKPSLYEKSVKLRPEERVEVSQMQVGEGGGNRPGWRNRMSSDSPKVGSSCVCSTEK